MNDDQLLRELRDAGHRSDARPTDTPLDAPLGPAFEARMADAIARGGRVVPIRRRRAGVLTATIGALAVAASVAVWFARPSAPQVSALPAYALNVTGGVDSERGAAPAAQQSVSARRGDTLAIVLRPAVDTRPPIEAHVMVTRGGTLQEAPSTQKVSGTGSIELRMHVTDLAETGVSDVAASVVLMRPGLDPRAIASAGEPAMTGARVLRLDVHVVP
jgi:hypothetical protein